MEGKTVIVTGGASGLGEDTARLLFFKGVNVSLFDRDAKRGEKIVAEWSSVTEKGKGRVIFSKVDVTKEGMLP